MSVLALPRPPAVPGGAMLLSVAVHAAALLLLPGLARHAEEQLPPIVATLRFLPAAQPAASEAAAPAAPKPAQPIVPAPRTARPPVLAAPAADASTPTRSTTAPAAPAESAMASPPPQAAIAAAGPAVATPASPAPSAALDTLVLDDYSRALSELLARQQQYPRLAALRGWEGEVRLRLKVARRGNLVAVQVVHSSGHEVLDQHALQMVQATALPSPPDSLGDREIQVVVPIHYKLQKPT